MHAGRSEDQERNVMCDCNYCSFTDYIFTAFINMLSVFFIAFVCNYFCTTLSSFQKVKLEIIFYFYKLVTIISTETQIHVAPLDGRDFYQIIVSAFSQLFIIFSLSDEGLSFCCRQQVLRIPENKN